MPAAGSAFAERQLQLVFERWDEFAAMSAEDLTQRAAQRAQARVPD